MDVAIEYNDPEVIKDFLDGKYVRDINAKLDEITLDDTVISSSENKVLSLLKQQYDEVMNHDHSLLYFACRQLHGHQTISHLINPNSIIYQDKQIGLSPLMVAVQCRQVHCVQELLSNKHFTQEAFNLVNHLTFRTVLHICAKVQNVEITNALFCSRFMTKTLAVATDTLDNTPLHICAQVGNIYMTQMLLGYITNHNLILSSLSKSQNFHPKINPDYNHRLLTVSSIDSTNSTINDTSYSDLEHRYTHDMLTKTNKDNLTPLHLAVQAGKLDVLNEMLKYADSFVINRCDDQQRNSLHMAAIKGTNR